MQLVNSIENNMSSEQQSIKPTEKQQILQMFNLLPDVLFWIKDIHSQIEYANTVYLEQVGVKNLEQALGKTDYDFFPPHIAKQFITDDKKVMDGELITDRVELNSDQKGNIAWFLTSKRPIFDEQGNITGSYGITRHLEKNSQVLSDVQAINAPVNFIKENFKSDIKIQQLADVAHLSVSALERRFKKYLMKTPKQFINQTRLEHARRLLVETQLPISEVAYQSGFIEHSYFSKQFRLLFDEQPSEVRNQNQSMNMKV